MNFQDEIQDAAVRLRSIVMVHINTQKQVLYRGLRNILSTETQLLDEIRKFREKKCKFVELVESHSNPSLKTENHFQAIEKKFNILQIKEDCFSAELMKALENRKKVDQLINPALEKEYGETESILEMTATLEKTDGVIKVVSDLMTRFESLDEAWKNMKVDMSADLDDCIQRLQLLIVGEDEN